MRCIREKIKVRGKAKRHRAQGQTAQPLQISPVSALVPVLLNALSAASTGVGAQTAMFDLNLWARAVVDALLARLISRVPKDGERCPITGLNRAQIYELIQPGPDGQPAILSFTLAEPGEASGARFFLIGSALDYLHGLAEKALQVKSPKCKDQGRKLKE
jgi:hypothetical protein